MQSPNDIEQLVKQANILGRLYRGTKGLVSGGAKGAMYGGLAGGLTALTGGMGLPVALGAAGGGIFSGAKAGASLGALGKGVSGLLSRPGSASRLEHLASAAKAPDILLPRGIPLALGAGAGYMLSGDDNKMLGMGMGALAGLAARPSIVKALQRRAGRL